MLCASRVVVFDVCFSLIDNCVLLVLLCLVLFFLHVGSVSFYVGFYFSRKSNLLDCNIKIATQPSLSWFDQSLIISSLGQR